nr:membrane-spanning 4-domains subfamily A member 13 isoform X1 [Oryctolagus cuniculus]XP_051710577.1 membrane-spanning 4-domains subfamily A member 13 isoform X1 [Oryctolagus cuniculus]XP_051710583.1 membrane-spanning 4-domains subfamily A member 13 isoform X1 [Oryctolagus cuniculus]XP_051710591.1 membrane-spanning 4-domains subfamily A member 13 isoform X1 [Oryctolagus cuniculus]
MACVCGSSKISTADSLVLGAIQIMIGIFQVLMWHFLLVLYMGQIKGVFGTYEPITYKTGCALWGVFFIISGAIIIRSTNHPTRGLIISALVMNIFSIITAIIAVVLIFIELSKFKSVSYRNYGQAKLGREVSRVLLFSYPLEFVTAFVYAVCSCSHLSQKREEHPTPVTEEVESTF